ncbi:DUF4365 domain-containing protein [Rhizobium sp. 1399]|uniref:DUF4365 domain-containing protein n=1 Tax=Rhizobium sp. 1399 TaxID=2817758 RepID=UPI002858BF26|nr:DUF4365 domain-containing protein [Rhizobium sp. 1399]MDR6670200.1 hypothetical protein [Rhizobium sp. 1399]
MADTLDQTDREGIHAVGLIFTRLNWIFREQPTSDYGIDAQAEKRNPDGKAGGKLIALQIKSGPSYFRPRGDGFVYYGEARHREYWSNHSLPVFLILHNPETNVTLWQRIEEHLIEEGQDGRWAIAIPADQTLDERHEHFIAAGIASDVASTRRAQLALDLPAIRQFAEHSEIYLRIEDWVNKTLNFRGAAAVFSEEPDAEADLYFNVAMPAYTIDYFMAVFFPWLDWTLHEYQDADDGAGEVALHILRVELSDVGKAALTLDEFYQSKLPPFQPEPEISYIRDEREDEWDIEEPN